MSKKTSKPTDPRVDALLQDYLAGEPSSPPSAQDLADELEDLLQGVVSRRPPLITDEGGATLDLPLVSEARHEDEEREGEEEFAAFVPTYAGKGGSSSGEAWTLANAELAADEETHDLLSPLRNVGDVGEEEEEGEALVGEEDGRGTLPGWLPRGVDDVDDIDDT